MPPPIARVTPGYSAIAAHALTLDAVHACSAGNVPDPDDPRIVASTGCTPVERVSVIHGGEREPVAGVRGRRGHGPQTVESWVGGVPLKIQRHGIGGRVYLRERDAAADDV